MQKIVLDTNCLIMSLSVRSPYYLIWKDFKEGKFVLCVTNEIISEYIEKLTEKMGQEIAINVVTAILARFNVERLNPAYRFNLITADDDDNKFVDCAIHANARYIVTNDHHFNVLKQIDFPKVEVIDIDTFIKFLSTQ